MEIWGYYWMGSDGEMICISMYIQLKDDLVWRKIGNVSPNYGHLIREDKPRGGLKWITWGCHPSLVVFFPNHGEFGDGQRQSLCFSKMNG